MGQMTKMSQSATKETQAWRIAKQMKRFYARFSCHFQNKLV